MDIQKLKELIELLKESGIAEIEIREGEQSIRVSRYAGPVQTLMQVPESASLSLESPACGVTVAQEPKSEAEGHKILAPMVGTFYTAASPTSPPFVRIGQTVKRGDIVCIIEAMKVMNQIESDVDGVVTALLVENGHPVEYGQPLLIVKRS
jgi:acetyl-CoA carboxylase biotin carboxyl carrier protein